MLRPAYPITTARLELRPFTPDDLDDLYAFHSLPAVTRYLMWEPRDREETREVLLRKSVQWTLTDEGQQVVLAVVPNQIGRVVGEVNLVWLSRRHRQGEIGYVFNPEFHGSGFATEAAAEMLRLGFADLGLHRVVARCDPRNSASVRVMERLGMRREAHFVHSEIFKGEWGDELVYAMLDDEWTKRVAGAGNLT